MKTQLTLGLLALGLAACTVTTPVTISPVPPPAVDVVIPILEPTATLPPSRFMLVYGVYPNGDGLYVLRDPSPPVRILEGDNFGDPQLSSDGQLIMYIQPNTSSEIWVVNIDGSNPRKLVNFDDLPPDNCQYMTTVRHWQAGTHAIYYSVKCVHFSEVEQPDDLWKVDADTGQITKLLEPERQRFSFSPDGRLIVAAHATGIDLLNSEGIAVKKDVLTYDSIKLFGLSGSGFIPPVVWSADSRFFSVAVQVGDPREIESAYTEFYRVTAEGVVSASGSIDGDVVVWRSIASPNGEYVIYSHDRQVDLFASMTESDVNDLRMQVSPENLPIRPVSWSPDSNWFVFKTGAHYYALNMAGEVTRFGDGVQNLFTVDLQWVDADTFIFSGEVNWIWGLYLQTIGAETQVLAGDVAPGNGKNSLSFDVWAAPQ